MLVILLACLYITFICWTWGDMCLALFSRMAGQNTYQHLPFSFTCMLGMILLTTIAGILSLFLALNNAAFHIALLSITFFLQFRNKTFSRLREELMQLKSAAPLIGLLGLLLLTMVLVMGSWWVYHPDTLGYHAQIIQWINDYRAVPGLVHLNNRLALQSSWFVACSFFGFKFTGSPALTFANSVFVFWYLLFVLSKMNSELKAGRWASLFCWAIFLTFNLWSFTQIRLTSISASPDFIAAVLSWAVFYLLLNLREVSNPGLHTIIILLFAIFSFTVKLSTIPLAIAIPVLFVQLVRTKSWREILISAAMAFLISFPFAVRSYIASGHFFYPIHLTNVAQADWEIDAQQMAGQVAYIEAYAKLPRAEAEDKVMHIVSMPAREWIPLWWANRSLADRILISFSFMSLIGCLVFIKRIFFGERYLLLLFVIALFGSVFWFLKAPDPRFGWGFILVFPWLLTLMLLKQKQLYARKLPTRAITFGLCLIVGSYVFFRFKNYYINMQWLQPLGIEKIPQKTIHCYDFHFTAPAESSLPCGNIKPPCLEKDCGSFMLRGKSISNGFKAKDQP